MVPVTLGYGAGNLTVAEAKELDDICTQSAREHFKFGLEDSRVVGVFPFHWSGGTTNPDGSITGGAVSGLPDTFERNASNSCRLVQF